ncbi:hypothetical protein M9458_023013, partial [Cirrhinus mrigala]
LRRWNGPHGRQCWVPPARASGRRSVSSTPLHLPKTRSCWPPETTLASSSSSASPA